MYIALTRDRVWLEFPGVPFEAVRRREHPLPGDDAAPAHQAALVLETDLGT